MAACAHPQSKSSRYTKEKKTNFQSPIHGTCCQDLIPAMYFHFDWIVVDLDNFGVGGRIRILGLKLARRLGLRITQSPFYIS